MVILFLVLRIDSSPYSRLPLLFSFLSTHIRSFLRRLFFEQTPAAANYKGLAWLFLGVAGSENLLYDADWQQTKQKVIRTNQNHISCSLHSLYENFSGSQNQSSQQINDSPHLTISFCYSPSYSFIFP